MAGKQYTDQELVRGCRRGKRRFQELLYKRYYGFAMSVCLRYTRNREDAYEVLNDSFMKVFTRIDSFKEDAVFRSWFRRILINTALDHYRTSSRHNIRQEWDETMEEVMLPDSDLNDLETEEILQLFALLPDHYRMTFNLFEIEGYNHEEIAGLLNISPGTSRSNLSRAKQMLRYHYQKMKERQGHEAV